MTYAYTPLLVQAFPICDLLQFGREAGSRACCIRLSQESVLGQEAFEEELMAYPCNSTPHLSRKRHSDQPRGSLAPIGIQS